MNYMSIPIKEDSTWSAGGQKGKKTEILLLFMMMNELQGPELFLESL
jgi:hypothetical protein